MVLKCAHVLGRFSFRARCSVGGSVRYCVCLFDRRSLGPISSEAESDLQVGRAGVGVLLADCARRVEHVLAAVFALAIARLLPVLRF